jgi:LacI family transcriptional regulator
MTNIKEVAKRAGVSVGTVSNVLNSLPTVSKDNIGKVREAIKELDFRPNRIAASLSSRKTSNIGLVVPDIASPYYADLIKGISDALEASGYNIFLCGSNDNLEKENKIINDLLSLWIDGIIIVPVYERSSDIDLINNIKIPTVLVNREIQGLNRDLCVFNNFKGAFDATKYLIDNNHKKIITLAGPQHSRSFEDRLLGWKEAIQEYGLYRNEHIFISDYSVESGYKSMEKALSQIKEIDAVFASSDLIALGAMNAIKEKHLSIPEDISIIGFGDIYLSKYLEPALTTIKRPFYNIGKTAVSMLMEKISGNHLGFESENPGKIIIEGVLEIRKSVAVKTN